TILVNNSPEISLQSLKSSKVTLINNNSNIGLAFALNVGILEAKKQGATMVALFDQDTLLPDDFSQNMLKNINAYQGDKKTAVFSPVFFNHVTNDYGPIINFKPFRLIRTDPANLKNVTHPHYVITSGSLIPISVLDDVGLMCEELFIDFVDIEWCLRARAKGYTVTSFSNIQIDHYLGDYSVSFLWTNYPIHSPLRMYYYFRNAMYLYRLAEIDWNWRVVDATRNLFRFLFYMLFVNDRPTYFRYIIKGYYHGYIKKMGKLEE
ncbi:MAG: glycosyltransferase family 2 protein, partial [Candidatus Pelagibacter sp.]|nr:glycosyltransferase family 2 protein [Candidatus Pelagibacter sp.]